MYVCSMYVLNIFSLLCPSQKINSGNDPPQKVAKMGAMPHFHYYH